MSTEKILPTKEQLKKLRNPNNYIVIKISYGEFVLPFKEGIEFITSFSKLEKYDKNYSSPTKVFPLNFSDIEIHVISQEEYEEAKVNHILGMGDE